MSTSDSTIKLVWENNPDTSLTAANLSRGTDIVASYMNFDYSSVNSDVDTHGEGRKILSIEPSTNNRKLLLKRGTIISLVNTIEKNGNKILSENDNYRVFDVGLEDISLDITYMDDNPANPASNWGDNKEWFVYLCDKMDDSLLKENTDAYGGGAQILFSMSRNYPIGEIPGQTGVNYNAKAVRKIGGFKSDAIGNIIPTSLWDIAQRHSIVRANDYYIFKEYVQDSGDYNRFINRKLRLSDLDSASDALTVYNNLTVQKSGSSTSAMSVNVNTNTVIIPNVSATNLNVTSISANSGTINSLTSISASIGTITSDIVSSKDNAWITAKATGPDNFTSKSSGVSIGYGGAKSADALHLVYNGDNTARIGIGTITGGAPAYEAVKFNVTDRVVMLGDKVTINGSGQLAKHISTPTLTGTSILGYDGYFHATRVYNAVWNDLAEFFLSKDKPKYGYVYFINDQGLIEPTTKRGMTSVIGVASDTMGFVLKSEYEDKGVPIALAGSVKVWVKDIVKPGTELVSDVNGYAAPASLLERIFNRGAIIGKALEPNLAKESNRILMLVK